MTLAHQLAAWLGMPPTPEQLGFLLTVLFAFVAGWLTKGWRDKLRIARYKRALWRGEKFEVRK